MSGLLELINAFTNFSTLLASIGMILATTSFISGLQMVKAKGPIERKIHRGNGFISWTIFLVLAVLSFATFGFSLWGLAGWTAGAFIILLKMLIVHSRKRRGVEDG